MATSFLRPSHQAGLLNTRVQLASPNSEPPSRVGAAYGDFLTIPGLNAEGFNYPFIPDLSVVALAPHVDNQFAIVGHVHGCLSMKISGAPLTSATNL